MIEDVKVCIIIFFIALLGIVYFKYNSPNQKIERYYKKEDETRYYIVKYNILFLKMMLILNAKYVIIYLCSILNKKFKIF